jgi:hypothetical protein
MATSFDTRPEQRPTHLLNYRTPTAPTSTDYAPEYPTQYQPDFEPAYEPQRPARRVGIGVDPRKLWAGGAVSAVISALVALVGVLACRWLFNLSVLAPHQDGAYGDMHTAGLVILAVAATIGATALVHLLMMGTQRPLLFFGWIVGLITVIAALFPFSTTAPLDGKIATAVVNVAIGITVGALIGGIAKRSFR